MEGIVDRGKWLGRPVNIKEANKQAKIYAGRPLTLHIFCFMLIAYAWITKSQCFYRLIV